MSSRSNSAPCAHLLYVCLSNVMPVPFIHPEYNTFCIIHLFIMANLLENSVAGHRRYITTSRYVCSRFRARVASLCNAARFRSPTKYASTHITHHIPIHNKSIDLANWASHMAEFGCENGIVSRVLLTKFAHNEPAHAMCDDDGLLAWACNRRQRFMPTSVRVTLVKLERLSLIVSALNGWWHRSASNCIVHIWPFVDRKGNTNSGIAEAIASTLRRHFWPYLAYK